MKSILILFDVIQQEVQMSMREEDHEVEAFKEDHMREIHTEMEAEEKGGIEVIAGTEHPHQ